MEISGYVLKEDAISEIVLCINELMLGNSYFSKALITKVEPEDDSLTGISLLTPSEKKILKLIAEKNSTQDIADMLHISERTVEQHRSNIVGKLNLPGESNSLTK